MSGQAARMVDQVAETAQLALVPTGPKLTVKQQRAFDYVRERDGVTSDEVGAWLHANRDKRPHGVDERCEWCARDGRSVLTSKAVAPLVTYRRGAEGRMYVARNPADVIHADPEPRRAPTEAELALDPFAGL